MRNPCLYNIEEIEELPQTQINGNWVTARPMPYPGLRLITTIKIAFGVLIGKYDAIKWYKQ